MGQRECGKGLVMPEPVKGKGSGWSWGGADPSAASKFINTMILFTRRFALILSMQKLGASVVAQRVKNWTSIHEDAGSIPGLAQWVQGSRVAASQA